MILANARQSLTRRDAELALRLIARGSDSELARGQEKLRDKMQVLVDAARMRGDTLDHVLLYGPPGLGKCITADSLLLTAQGLTPFGEILREPPDCAPCMLRDCPIDHRCMTAITPAAVFERALALLSDKSELACQATPLAQAIDKLKFAGQLK